VQSSNETVPWLPAPKNAAWQNFANDVPVRGLQGDNDSLVAALSEHTIDVNTPDIKGGLPCFSCVLYGQIATSLPEIDATDKQLLTVQT
jgi:hypothetical protein